MTDREYRLSKDEYVLTAADVASMAQRSCPVVAGPDRCVLPAHHDGDHETYWGDHIVMHWRGDQPWSHRIDGTA